MGLTIHYSLKARTKSPAKARSLVERMRQLAMDLPFAGVGELQHLTAKDFTDVESLPRDDPKRWQISGLQSSVHIPWSPKLGPGSASCRINPEEAFCFDVEVGEGSEWMTLGLVRYPETVEREYSPKADRRFLRVVKKDGWTSSEFNYEAARRYANRKGHWSYRGLNEVRTIKTHLSGWRHGSFCKTQYASDPACGGVANFLRCHISAITLLERIGELPGVKVEISDEGDYGQHWSCPDWRQADAEKRERVYAYHPGHHDPKKLAAEVGSWNEMIAATLGGLKDAFPGQVEAPIAGFANFEQLEFRGCRDASIEPFLAAMKQIAKTTEIASAH